MKEWTGPNNKHNRETIQLLGDTLAEYLLFYAYARAPLQSMCGCASGSK